MDTDSRTAEAQAFLAQHQSAFSTVTHMHLPEKDDEALWEEKLLKDELLVSRFKAIHDLKTKDEVKNLFRPSGGELDHIRYIAAQLIESAPADIQPSLRNLPVGSLPTLDLNAQTVRHPEGYSIIVLHTGTVISIYRIVCSFLGTLPVPGSQPEWSFLEAANWIMQSLAATAFGEPRLGYEQIPVFRHPRRMAAAGSLVDNACAFILGHEYSHFLLRHSEARNATPRGVTSCPGQPPLEFYNRKQNQEFEADENGFEFAIRFCRNTHTGSHQIVYMAIVFFLQILDLLELFLPTGRTESHPPAKARRAAFERLHRFTFDEEMCNEIAYVDAFFTALRPIAEMATAQLHLS
jgi:hypothetical protein